MVRGRKKSAQESEPESAPSRRSSRSAKKVSYSEEADYEPIPPGQFGSGQPDEVTLVDQER